VYFPDPESCAKFCECSNGIAIALTCPPGTLFDADLGVCATASDVDCGNRP
ncbi:Chitin binding domain, partial [Trinorchestia longiramus]